MAEKTGILAVLRLDRENENKEYDIRVRISRGGTRRYVNLGLTSSLKDWDAKKGMPKKSHPFKGHYDAIIVKTILAFKEREVVLTHEGKAFTADMVIEEFFLLTRVATTEGVKKASVLTYINDVAETLKKMGKLDGASVHRNLYNQLKKFNNGQDLDFPQITYDFLVDFEQTFRDRGCMDTYISTLFRKIRRIFKEAIRKGDAQQKDYPFDVYKITTRFSDTTLKRAIPKKDIMQIKDIVLDTSSPSFKAQQYFMFSYYGMGINFADIANLKWTNLIGNRIFYRRSKTNKDFTINLSKPSLDILEHFRPLTQDKGNIYIFPIYNQLVHTTVTKRSYRRKNELRRVNRDLKAMGKSVGIDIKLTTYVARHTFATVLKKKGVKTAIISEAMGHKSEAVTQIYLDSFENTTIDKAMKNLL